MSTRGMSHVMSERDDEDEGGRFAVPGRESHESDETLTEEERGEPPKPPEYVPPVEPRPSRQPAESGSSDSSPFPDGR